MPPSLAAAWTLPLTAQDAGTHMNWVRNVMGNRVLGALRPVTGFRLARAATQTCRGAAVRSARGRGGRGVHLCGGYWSRRGRCGVLLVCG